MEGAKFGTKGKSFVSSNSIPPYLRTTESTPSRQPKVSATTPNSAGAPPRSPAQVSTEDRSWVGGSPDCPDEQSRIVLLPETGEQSSLSSGLRDTPWLNRRRPGSLCSIIEYSLSRGRGLCGLVCVYYCSTYYKAGRGRPALDQHPPRYPYNAGSAGFVETLKDLVPDMQVGPQALSLSRRVSSCYYGRVTA